MLESSFEEMKKRNDEQIQMGVDINDLGFRADLSKGARGLTLACGFKRCWWPRESSIEDGRPKHQGILSQEGGDI